MIPNPKLPKNLADLFASSAVISQENLQLLKEAGEEVDRDPELRSELLKGLFVNSVLSALQSQGLKKIEVSRRMKCSRQNLNRLLKEDSSVNFTIETMCRVAAAINRRVEILVLCENEAAHILKCCRVPQTSNYAPVKIQFSESSAPEELTLPAESAHLNIVTAFPKRVRASKLGMSEMKNQLVA